MTSEEVLLEKFKVLPLEKKYEVLDFVEFLSQKAKMKTDADSIEEDLILLDENELKHLEMEFENYEQIYPRR